MRPSRVIVLWSALGLCALLVIGAMIWLTSGVLAAERDRVTAEQERSAAENRADLEERTRLALWRMDAMGAAIMLRENLTPVDFYQSSAVPGDHPEVLLHFEIRKGSAVRSPQQKNEGRRGGPVTQRLQQLRTLLAAHPLPGNEWSLLCEAAMVGESNWGAVPKEAEIEKSDNEQQRLVKSGEELRKEDSYQFNVNSTERAQRAKAVAQTVDAEGDVLKNRNPVSDPKLKDDREVAVREISQPEAMSTGQMRTVWLGGELFLLRRLSSSTVPLPHDLAVSSAVQGVWMDWQILRQRLLGEISDLLPHAALVPAGGERAAEDPMALVSFPLRLVSNELPTATATALQTRIGTPLWIAWSAVALAILTSTLLVSGIMRLSERRASFVSAVTHELRTPLTTFRLYSDMLENGAVREEKRGDYLRVLTREADRLSHLVENVLAFSRIERGSARAGVRTMTAAALLDPMRERFEARLETSGLALEMDLPSETGARVLRVDGACVEHILFNLIDNAAKYAVSSDPAIVHLTVGEAASRLEIIIRDHGPGIPIEERRRIFRPFHKSARDAAESRPGVGLGLALSLRLARSIGGTLDCVDTPKGASFILRLPVA